MVSTGALPLAATYTVISLRLSLSAIECVMKPMIPKENVRLRE